MPNGITVKTDDLQKSARKYRKDLLMMPVLALDASLPFMSLRTGIRYSETVGELSGDAQFGPYSVSRKDTDDLAITPRTLYTYFGSVQKTFEPNQIVQTLWGADITKGDGLKGTDMTRQVVAYLCAQLGKNLNKVLWSAVRNDKGDKSKDLFNGFDTITATEQTAGTISADAGNLVTIEAITKSNAVDILKSICRAADEELTDGPTQLVVPKHVFWDYCEDYKVTTGSIPYNKEFQQYYVEGFDNVSIVPLSNKKNSPYIHLTPKKNLLIGVNQTGEEEQIEVERFEAFVLTLVATMFFGAEFESISKERLLVATIDGKTLI